MKQHPILYEQRNDREYYFISDFHCVEKQLIVELDGKIHDYQQYYDYNRDFVLEEIGLTTLRIKNEELEDVEKTKTKILNYME